MTRWISSALCTMVLVAVLFCLPVWDIRSAAAVSNISNIAASTMSEVHIVKRIPKKAPPAVQKKVQPKSVPTIPTPPAEPAPTPEPEPPDPETAPEPDELAEETVDDTPASDSDASAADDTSSVPGTENSFANTQDAKAAATYKSYALERIASKKKYPYTARSNGFEGRVRIRIVINPDGTLAQTDILEPSEHEILNNACLAAVKKAAPFKKMASGMSAMTLSFVMDFSLK